MSSEPLESSVGPRRGEPVEAPPATRAKLRAAAATLARQGERTFWQMLPRRNLRRALFLLLVLLGVLAIRRGGGLSFNKVFDDLAPPPGPSGTFQHLEVQRPSPPSHP